ncbi:lectin subunit alpha-like [Cochliomyia hominivorax]
MTTLMFSKIILFLLIWQQVCGITHEKLYTSDGKKIFYIENEYKYDWFEALTKCARMNMTLLTIDSKSKSDNINQIVLKTFGKNIVLWAGGYAVGTNRDFKWVATGEEFTYTFWHGANPDFSGKVEFCMQIGWGSKMEWNDNNCTKKFGFVCEFRPNEYNDDKNFRNQNIVINNYQKA